MQSESREPLLNTSLKVILVLLIAVIIIVFVLYRNLFFQSTYLLKSFGELSVKPEIAFKNNKPTFLEFMLSGVKFVKRWLQKYMP